MSGQTHAYARTYNYEENESDTHGVQTRWHDKMKRSMRDSREREGSEIKREEGDKQSEIAGGTSDYCHELLPLTFAIH